MFMRFMGVDGVLSGSKAQQSKAKSGIKLSNLKENVQHTIAGRTLQHGLIVEAWARNSERCWTPLPNKPQPFLA